jgi:hypothetical protein
VVAQNEVPCQLTLTTAEAAVNFLLCVFVTPDNPLIPSGGHRALSCLAVLHDMNSVHYNLLAGVSPRQQGTVLS